MEKKRLALPLVFLLALVGIASIPVAAAGFDSVTEELIWTLNNKLLVVAIPVTLITEAVLIYTVLKFRNSEEAKPTRENRRLEITWTVATAVILLFVGIASYQVLADPNVTAPADPQIESEGAVEVDVIAQKYFWTFEYPETGVSVDNELVLPTDRPVYLNITSTDWLHSFHVPELALKQDAVPGEGHMLRTEIHNTGTYQLYCAEYCGAGHSKMLGTVRVVSPDEFDSWLDEQA